VVRAIPITFIRWCESTRQHVMSPRILHIELYSIVRHEASREVPGISGRRYQTCSIGFSRKVYRILCHCWSIIAHATRIVPSGTLPFNILQLECRGCHGNVSVAMDVVLTVTLVGLLCIIIFRVQFGHETGFHSMFSWHDERPSVLSNMRKIVLIPVSLYLS